jgi:hypothetical protein
LAKLASSFTGGSILGCLTSASPFIVLLLASLTPRFSLFLEFLGVVVLTHPFPVMVFVDNHESSRKIIAEAVACTLYQEHPDLTGTKGKKTRKEMGRKKRKP